MNKTSQQAGLLAAPIIRAFRGGIFENRESTVD